VCASISPLFLAEILEPETNGSIDVNGFRQTENNVDSMNQPIKPRIKYHEVIGRPEVFFLVR
jgi:hypothetical protein